MIDPTALKNAYESFFIKHEAGKYFMAMIEQTMTNYHEKAETSPEHARDYTQAARGIREVIKHIDSVTPERRRMIS